MPDNPAFLTASEALKRIHSGELSVEALADACLERVAVREPMVRAWAHVDPGYVRAQARELDRRGTNGNMGALHGIPIGVKDVILTEDMPTQYNSPIYRGFHPRIDAACITILRAAGALIFGKTETVEFASTGRKAPTCNPHDFQRTPGGSSSGSGAAVADFHVPLALGTQTGGSMIRPASFCGVYAMKPTWNLVNRDGAKVYSVTLDTIGWFGRSAADLALLYDVFDPERPEAPALDIARSRLAICRSPAWECADAASKNAFFAAADTLRKAGAIVDDLALPSPFEELIDLQNLIMRTEGRSAFLAEYRTNPEQLDPNIREQVENAAGYTRQQLLAAYDVAALCRSVFDRIAAKYDAVLTLSAVGEAPLGLASSGEMTFNAMWSLLHVPCVNVPGFVGLNGLPVGLTVTGPRFSDRRVLAAAAAFGRLFEGPLATDS